MSKRVEWRWSCVECRHLSGPIGTKLGAGREATKHAKAAHHGASRREVTQILRFTF